MNIRFSVLLSLACLVGCSGDYPHADQEVGENGEPPKALEQRYQRQFQADEKNYVLALGRIHAFLVENQFSTKYTDCFDDVLDIRKRKKGFSCLVLRAEKGPPTKVYFRVIVDDVNFNQLDDHNRLLYSVEIYSIDPDLGWGITELLRDFGSEVASSLAELHSGSLGDYGSDRP